MKQKIKLFAILLFSVVLFACNNNPKQSNESTDKSASRKTGSTGDEDTTIVIASVTGGVTMFVADPTILKSDWQTFINSQLEPESCTLTKVEIVPNSDASIYYLVASGTMSGGENMKASIELEQGSPSCLMVSGFTVTCTTSACSSEGTGCVPVLLACNPCSNGGKCTKTVSSSPTAIFPSIATSLCSN